MQVCGATRTVDFSSDAVGQPPKGFEFFHTKKIGSPGKWIVETDGSGKHVSQTKPISHALDFPSLC